MKKSDDKQKKSNPDILLRQQTIVEIVQEGEYYTQEEIVEALREKGIFTSQGVVSRDLNDLNIEKGDNKYYQVSRDAIKQIHVDKLISMLEKKQHTYYPNVTYVHLKTEKGKASAFAFHLQEAYSEVILDTTIGIDSLVLLINNDAKTANEVLTLLKNH